MSPTELPGMRSIRLGCAKLCLPAPRDQSEQTLLDTYGQDLGKIWRTARSLTLLEMTLTGDQVDLAIMADSHEWFPS